MSSIYYYKLLCLVAWFLVWNVVDGFSYSSLHRRRHGNRPWHTTTRTTRQSSTIAPLVVGPLPAMTTKTILERSVNDEDDADMVAEPQEHVPTNFAEAFQVFLLGSYNGPRIVVMLLLGLATWRLQLSPSLSAMDAVVLVTTILFWCVQEHVLHGRVLHSQVDWYGKQIHEQHHAKPYHHVSIDPAWLMLTWMGVVHVMFLRTMPLPLALSATIGYAASGLWYEFLHFIVHTRVRFSKGSYLQTMKDHHARHHLIDHNYWLGFSLPVVDDLFGTNPTVAQVRRWKQQQ